MSLYGLRQATPHGTRTPDLPPEASSTQGAGGVRSAVPKLGDETSGIETGIARFSELLGKLRANDESVVAEMREIAELLCTRHGRCDGKQILAFYLGLTPEERSRGLERQRRFSRIRASLEAHWHEGHPDEQWAELRPDALAELESISADSLHDADVFPGACASSSRAWIETEQLISDSDLSESERDDLLERARRNAEDSLDAFWKCGMLAPSLLPMWTLGYLQSAAGDTLDARRSFGNCLALARRLDNAAGQEKAFRGLLDLAKEAGDVGEIGGLLMEMAQLEPLRESWLLILEHTIFLLEQDDAAAAADFLLAHPRTEPGEEREWRLLLGSARLRQGDLDAARNEFAQAERPPWGVDVRRAMALVDLREGNAERALDQLSRPEFLEQSSPLGRAYALELCGEALLKLGRIEEAASRLEQALDIGGRVQARLSPQRDVIGAATSVIGESIGVHAIALLAEARALSGDALEAARSIEDWQSRTLRAAGSKAHEVSKEDLLEWARSTELGLVTWVVGVDASVVACVAPDGRAEAVRIARGRRSIEAGARRINEALRSSDDARAEHLALQIRAELLPPIVQAGIRRAGKSGRDRLLFLVHGPVERIPIEYLLRDEPVIPLILPGLPEVRPGSPIRPEDWANWNLLGAPTDPQGRQLLPGAREELAEIAALHRSRRDRAGTGADEVQASHGTGVQLRTGPEFDREALLAALNSRESLHVATHLKRACGAEQGRIADVGLELSGGDRFCAHEVLEARPKPLLAVLDACETAEGRFVDAEGLQGISRTFLESGTRDLLVTLWPVEDQAARELAREFHRALLAGESPSLAATTARGQLRSRGIPAADWAAFRLVGRD